MQSFRNLERRFGQTSAPIGRLLSNIDVARGREMAFRLQHPEVLQTLTEIAIVQSVEASNAIEHITAPLKRIEQLVADKTTPRNRSEEEIAGYRSVLNTIHSSAVHIPLKPSVIEQLIDTTKESYYEALEKSTIGWHEGDHDLEPWTRYFLGVVLAAYRAFEDRAGMLVGARGAKAELVKNFIRSSVSDTFRVQDVRRAVPSVSDIYIRQILRGLKSSGALAQLGRGQSASWKRLHTNF
jgi:hypothetical protein